MPPGLGAVEPVQLTIALADFGRTSEMWRGLIGEAPAVSDVTSDGRRRMRFRSRSVVHLDLVEAGGSIRPGDSELKLWSDDVDARIAAVRAAGISLSVDQEGGQAEIAAQDANGVAVVFTRTRPTAAAGPVLNSLPYVFDIAVAELDSAIPTWNAILGVEGVFTPEETDSARQYEMHHYVVGGEAHALGLMKLRPGRPVPYDTLGSSQEHILQTHGDGLLCVGFLYNTDLDEHIASLSESTRSLLIFDSPRSYMMGRNNMSHAEATGGVAVVIAQHFEGWEGDPRAAVDGTWRPSEPSDA